MDIIETTGWIVAQVFMVILAVLYMVFAGVVIKQVNIMITTLTLSAGKLVKVVAWVHLLLAFLIVIATILIL
jgi:hypothetical protein